MFHAVVGLPLVAVTAAVSGICQGPLGFLVAVGLSYMVSLPLLFAFGYRTAAFWMVGVLAGLLGAWFAVAWVRLEWSRRFVRHEVVPAGEDPGPDTYEEPATAYPTA